MSSVRTLRTLLSSNATANVLLAVTCVVVIWAVLGRPNVSPVAEAMDDVWPRGSQSPIALSASGPTAKHVIVFVHSQCRYCAQEIGFYRELQALAEGQPIHLYAVSTEGADVVDGSLNSSGLMDFATVGNTSVPELPATPTVLLIDGRGTVIRSWRGVMSRRQKDQLKELL